MQTDHPPFLSESMGVNNSVISTFEEDLVSIFPTLGQEQQQKLEMLKSLFLISF
jgi:hypothetical protein